MSGEKSESLLRSLSNNISVIYLVYYYMPSVEYYYYHTVSIITTAKDRPR